jgi:hypothetical protein
MEKASKEITTKLSAFRSTESMQEIEKKQEPKANLVDTNSATTTSTVLEREILLTFLLDQWSVSAS